MTRLKDALCDVICDEERVALSDNSSRNVVEPLGKINKKTHKSI